MARQVSAVNLAQWCWGNLRRFQNVEYVSDFILRLHRLPERYRKKAKDRARDIRFCLLQAKEYYDAALRVSLATKPTLLYYSTMNLALAEAILKQFPLGLDFARANHAHHGLDFKFSALPQPTDRLGEAASLLRACPIHRSGKPSGTFAFWHESAREHPICGEIERYLGSGNSTKKYDVILTPGDEKLPPLKNKGISLFDCLISLPRLRDEIAFSGGHPNFIRTEVKVMIRNGSPERIENQIIIHPQTDISIDKFLEQCKFEARAIDRLAYSPLPSGGIVRWTNTPSDSVGFRLPHGCMIENNSAMFWLEDQPVNEFGFYFLALFIAGNYARYFPERWGADMQTHSYLAQAIESLTASAETVIPLLALSELGQVYLVMES